MTVSYDEIAEKLAEIDLDDKDFRADFLRSVEKIAEEAGDWRDHLPYDAVLAFHGDDAVREKFKDHVDSCAYCQELIDTLQPSAPLLGHLHTLVRNQVEQASVNEQSAQAPQQGYTESRSSNVFGIAASLAAIAAIGLLIFSTMNTRAVGDLTAALLDQYPDIISLERSEKPADRFAAARIYLAATHPDIAYERIGEGLQLGGLETSLASMISTAPRLEGDSLANLQAAEIELKMLAAKQPLSTDEQFRLVQLQAQLGNHRGAFTVLEQYLSEIGTDEKVLTAYRENLVTEPR